LGLRSALGIVAVCAQTRYRGGWRGVLSLRSPALYNCHGTGRRRDIRFMLLTYNAPGDRELWATMSDTDRAGGESRCIPHWLRWTRLTQPSFRTRAPDQSKCGRSWISTGRQRLAVLMSGAERRRPSGFPLVGAVDAPAVGDVSEVVLARGSKVNSLPATRSSTVWETSTWDGSASAEIRAPPWTRSALLCGSGRRPPRGRRPMGQSTAMFAAAALAGISRMRAGLSRSASRKDGARREGRQGSRGSGDCRLSRVTRPSRKHHLSVPPRRGRSTPAQRRHHSTSESEMFAAH